jgi:hypothetical protein
VKSIDQTSLSRGGTAKAWGLSLQLPLRLDPQIQLQLSI